MRKLLLFLIALPLLAQSVALTVTPQKLASGGTAVLTLTFTDSSSSSGMAAAQWTLTPPAGATLAAPALGAASTAAGKVIQCGTGSFAALCLDAGIGSTLNANIIGSGVLATYAVTVPAGTAPGPIPLGLTGLLGANATAGSAVALATTGTTLTVTSIYDLNGDGVVNSADVQIMVTAFQTPTCTGAAAAVGDGKCDITGVMQEILAALGVIH